MVGMHAETVLSRDASSRELIVVFFRLNTFTATRISIDLPPNVILVPGDVAHVPVNVKRASLSP